TVRLTPLPPTPNVTRSAASNTSSAAAFRWKRSQAWSRNADPSSAVSASDRAVAVATAARHRPAVHAVKARVALTLSARRQGSAERRSPTNGEWQPGRRTQANSEWQPGRRAHTGTEWQPGRKRTDRDSAPRRSDRPQRGAARG